MSGSPSGVLQRLLETEKRIPDSGNATTIKPDRDLGVLALTSTGAETRTIADPDDIGIRMTICGETIGGTVTLTFSSAYDEAGTTTMAFTATGQAANFVSVAQGARTYVWRLVGHPDGLALPALNVTTLSLGGTALTATATEINRNCDASARIVNCTAATLSLTEATHDGTTVTLNRAAGIAVTLPAATGSGMRLRLFLGTTVTSNTTTITRAGSDTMFGMIYQLADGGSTLAAYECAGATVITLDGSTKGGIKGDYFELEDVASGTWSIIGHTSATGTEATPVT